MKEWLLSIRKNYGLHVLSIPLKNRNTTELSGIENLLNIDSQVQEDIREQELWYLEHIRRLKQDTQCLLNLEKSFNF
jgi:hypothetical protein